MSGGGQSFIPGGGYSAEFRDGRWVAVDNKSTVVNLESGTPIPVMISDELDSGVIIDRETGAIIQIIIHNYS